MTRQRSAGRLELEREPASERQGLLDDRPGPHTHTLGFGSGWGFGSWGMLAP